MANEDRLHQGDIGITFLKTLFHLIHAARIHNDNNHLIRESLEKFKDILNETTREEDLKLQIWRGRFHIGGEKLPYNRDAAGVINQLLKYFSRRDVSGLQFLITSKKASASDLMMFIRLFDDSVKHENPAEWLDRKLVGHALSWVQLYTGQDDEAQGAGDGTGMQRHERAKNSYLCALDTVKEVADKASKGIAGVRKARRLAQTIVDLIQEDTSLILGLATIKDYDDYTYTHSVNVSLLATCLGRHIGMPDVLLECLSMCGLFHDLGKVGVSIEVLHKQGVLSEDEWKDMQRHPLLGVRKILRLNADSKMRSKIILGPFEHHLNPDMTGYPKTHFMKKISLMGKILRIADVYEALTAERAYRPRSFTPEEALRKMWSEGSRSFDLILLKRFIHMMGIYPIGSIVELNDGRVALVTDYPEKARRDMPLIMLLPDDGKGGLCRGELFPLSRQTLKDGTFPLNIVRSIHPSGLGINVGEFFLQESPN
jgi:HD-GYP domain-containing protein (c-di-GMP phosphodiesterase class II)